MYTKGISKESEETLKNWYECAVFNRMQYLNLYRNNDSCGYPLHWHALNEIEFIMPVVNEFNVLCDGKQIHLKEDEILIIPHGCVHRLLPSEEPGERIIFIADLGLLCQFKEYRSLFAFRIPPTKIDSSMAEIQKKMSRCIRELEKEYFSENRMRSSCIYALLLQIFVILARGSINQKERGARGSLLWPEKLAVVIEYLEKHCGEDLTEEKMAKHFGYSQEELRNLLKQYTSLEFQEYLTNLRMNRAEEYLSEHHEYSIEEVAMLCGFGSYNAFVRCFKEKKGCNPSEYRNYRY